MPFSFGSTELLDTFLCEIHELGPENWAISTIQGGKFSLRIFDKVPISSYQKGLVDLSTTQLSCQNSTFFNGQVGHMMSGGGMKSDSHLSSAVHLCYLTFIILLKPVFRWPYCLPDL